MEYTTINEDGKSLDCSHCVINGDYCVINGNDNTINGKGCAITGDRNKIRGSGCFVFGKNNVSCADGNQMSGIGNINEGSVSYVKDDSSGSYVFSNNNFSGVNFGRGGTVNIQVTGTDVHHKVTPNQFSMIGNSLIVNYWTKRYQIDNGAHSEKLIRISQQHRQRSCLQIRLIRMKKNLMSFSQMRLLKKTMKGQTYVVYAHPARKIL